jgi:hypothetical protein
VNIARPLKGKGIADSGGKDVVFGIVLKLFREFDLCSLAVFEFVHSTGGGSDKIAKVWHERVVEKGYEDIRAEARCRATEGVIPGDNSGSIVLKRVELVHPCRRFGMLIGEYVRDLGLLVFADAHSCSAGEAITHRVVQ